MAEPSTTPVFVYGLTIVAATFVTGLNPNILIGAFAGASLFVISAKDLRLFTRLMYLSIGVVMGYLGGPTTLGPVLKEPSVSAFVFAAAIVTVGLKVIDGVDKLDLTHWLKPPK